MSRETIRCQVFCDNWKLWRVTLRIRSLVAYNGRDESFDAFLFWYIALGV